MHVHWSILHWNVLNPLTWHAEHAIYILYTHSPRGWTTPNPLVLIHQSRMAEHKSLSTTIDWVRLGLFRPFKRDFWGYWLGRQRNCIAQCHRRPLTVAVSAAGKVGTFIYIRHIRSLIASMRGVQTTTLRVQVLASSEHSSCCTRSSWLAFNTFQSMLLTEICFSVSAGDGTTALVESPPEMRMRSNPPKHEVG